MNREKWQQVKQIFQSALERAPDEREVFLADACADDAGLYREVEILLASFENADGDSFMKQAAIGEVADMMVGAKNKLETGKCFGHYEIIKQIGAGGMGEVYLAKDKKLDRQVAIKILNEEFSRHESNLKRFIREAKAASGLNHPNILVIHEIGEAENANYIVSEFIEGKTLREHFKESPMNLSEILDISIQIAGALAAAHTARIIHRDIKPENIMIRRDRLVKVLDFGLAKLSEKAIETPESEAETRAQIKTAPGLIMGTAGYMSPEQARGKDTDARTDIWSFGVVLYEMLTRQQPFIRETIPDTIAAVLTKEPDAPTNFNGEIPVELERIVLKTLVKDVEERYQTAKDLLVDLKRLKKRIELDAEIEQTASANKQTAEQSGNATQTLSAQTTSSAEYIAGEIKNHKIGFVVLSVLILAAAGLGYWFFLSRSTDTTQIESIAVLPFVDASGNADTEYLSDGMTETLINNLSQLPKLSVKARSTVFRYKGKDVLPQQVGNELNVQAVLNGRVVQRGNDLVLYLSLVDVKTGNQIWGEQYNRKLTDLVSLQSEIARDVSNKLKTKLSGEDEQKLVKNYTANPEAYRLYLLGLFYWNKTTPKDLQKAVEYFQQAVAVDPNYALAYAGLANGYATLSNYRGASSREAMPKAKEAVAKALSLDSQSSDAHSTLAYILLFNDYDFAGAEREFKQAIELNPNNWIAHYRYGVLLSILGKHDEALAECQRALEIEPLSLISNRIYGETLFFARRYDESIAQLKKTNELDANFPSTHFSLSLVYQAKGNYAEAAEELAKSTELTGNIERAAQMRESFAKGGYRGWARWMTGQPSFYWAATAHVVLGEKDEAFTKLNKAIDARESLVVRLKVDPFLDPLRDDQRYKDLLKRMNLPE